jgi:hypothetical protein
MKKKNILIISYNRPDKLSKVLDNLNINFIKSIYFYNNSYKDIRDKEKVENCRKLIKNFKFKGKKYYLFNKKHLDVKSSILKSLDWFFSFSKEGIILEDDIVPSKSFYFFCSKLLDKYRDNKKIYHISGFNHLEKINSPFTYHYNHITHVWGWATWADRWNNFRMSMKQKELKIVKKNFFLDAKLNNYRKYLYNRTLQNKIITWDYFWDMFIRINNGLNIRPNLNLVRNIGFDLKATNTKFYNRKLLGIKTYKINTIKHPKLIFYFAKNDNEYFKLYEKKNLELKKKYDFIRDVFKKII